MLVFNIRDIQIFFLVNFILNYFLYKYLIYFLGIYNIKLKYVRVIQNIFNFHDINNVKSYIEFLSYLN